MVMGFPNFDFVAGYNSDDGSPNRVHKVDMSLFRDTVKDYLDNEESNTATPMPNQNNLNSQKTLMLRNFLD